MSRRRRLALRQIEEPEVAVALSDAEDERDMLMQMEAGVQQPNFSLLPGMMMNVGSTPEAPVVLVDSDEEMADTHAPTQLVNSQSQSDVVATPPPKKPRIDSASAAIAHASADGTDGGHPTGVFQLYQTGICSDHTLRLHYIRQRPPPPPAKRIEEEFVLPRPRLSLLDALPPTKISFREILDPTEADPDFSIAATCTRDSISDLAQILLSVQTHWRQLASVDATTLVSWRDLQEHEWRQAYTSADSFVPPTNALIHAMETLRSDEFASFIWKLLLPPILQRMHSDKTHSSLQSFAAALLCHSHFRRLPAKDFRAQLRSHQLRTIDAAFGAMAELALVTMFHKFRNSDL